MKPANKRGVSLPINVIIIALIALAVLVVLLFIFGGKARIFSKTVSKTCTERGGAAPSEKGCPPEKPIMVWVTQPEGAGAKDTATGLYPCCIPVGG